MSLRYRDKNGVETVVSGLTPGGNIEYGAVATRKGTYTIGVVAPGASNNASITFDEPMPDGNYLVYFSPNTNRLNLTTSNIKTKNGFSIFWYNISDDSTQADTKVTWTAYKLYDVADAEQLYSQLQDISAMVPANASSVNQFSTKSDLQSINRALDMRLDDIEDIIPNDASILNKLATKDQVDEAMANAGLAVRDEVPSNPADGDVMLYIGTETGFRKGGIYQYAANPGAWILISTAEVDLSHYSTTFVGTTAQWNALSTAEKNQYALVSLTDDKEALGVDAVDAVINGDMRPVTSNAVNDIAFNATVNPYGGSTYRQLHFGYLHIKDVKDITWSAGLGGYYADISIAALNTPPETIDVYKDSEVHIVLMANLFRWGGQLRNVGILNASIDSLGGRINVITGTDLSSTTGDLQVGFLYV